MYNQEKEGIDFELKNLLIIFTELFVILNGKHMYWYDVALLTDDYLLIWILCGQTIKVKEKT